MLVLFTWDLPDYLGGIALASYRVEIRAQDGQYYEKTPECDGTDDTVISARSCQVSHLDLQAAPFYLEQGVLVQFRVSTLNDVGESLSSAPNISGAIIETVPHKPPVAPTKNSSTTKF